mgnify:FL=1
MSEHVLLQCSGLELSVGDTQVTSGLDFSINTGQCWCILGRNGCGKTTLLHTLAGLRKPNRGTVRVSGQPLPQYSRRQLATRIGILFQDFDDPFPATVLETVLQGRHPYLNPWQWESAPDLEIALEALAFVGMDSFGTRNIQTLSGGERQRVGIAALRAQQPDLLLLDEPTSHLDMHHTVDILERLVASCRKNNQAICLVLHDVNLATRLADHVLLLLGNGKSRSGSCENMLTTTSLEQLYQHPLIQLETPMGPVWLPT